jgi:hypothetical protein
MILCSTMTSEHSIDILNNVFAKNCNLTTTKTNTKKNKKITIKAIKQIKKVSFLDEKKYFIINDDGVAIEKYMYRRPRSNAIIS